MLSYCLPFFSFGFTIGVVLRPDFAPGSRAQPWLTGDDLDPIVPDFSIFFTSFWTKIYSSHVFLPLWINILTTETFKTFYTHRLLDINNHNKHSRQRLKQVLCYHCPFPRPCPQHCTLMTEMGTRHGWNSSHTIYPSQFRSWNTRLIVDHCKE